MCIKDVSKLYIRRPITHINSQKFVYIASILINLQFSGLCDLPAISQIQNGRKRPLLMSMYEEINRKIQSEYEESYRRALICLNLVSFENKHLRYLQIRNPRRQILWNFRKSCSATVNIGTKARTIRRTHIILSKSWIQKTTPNKSGPNEEINGRHVGFWIINVDAMKSNDHCVSTITISFLCPLYNSTCIS